MRPSPSYATDQAQKNVILGSSSDPRIKIKDQDQVWGSGSNFRIRITVDPRIKIKDQDQILGSGSRREIRIKIDPDLNLIQDQLYIGKKWSWYFAGSRGWSWYIILILFRSILVSILGFWSRRINSGSRVWSWYIILILFLSILALILGSRFYAYFAWSWSWSQIQELGLSD